MVFHCPVSARVVVLAARPGYATVPVFLIPKLFFFQVFHVVVSLVQGLASDTRPGFRRFVPYFHTYQTPIRIKPWRLREAEFARPWLMRAPENRRYPVVSKSFWFVQSGARPLTFFWLWTLWSTPIQFRLATEAYL